MYRRGRMELRPTVAAHAAAEEVRTGMSAEAIKRDYLDNLFYIQGRFAALASLNDQYMALAYTVRDRLLRRWVPAGEVFLTRKVRTVVYLSAEFLLGPHLDNNLMS